MAFLGAIGIVGFIAGIALIVLGKMKKKKYRGGLAAVVSFVLFIVAIVLTPNVDYEIVEEETSGSVSTKMLAFYEAHTDDIKPPQE